MNCPGGGQKCNGHHTDRGEGKRACLPLCVLPVMWSIVSWRAIRDNLAPFSLRSDYCFEVVISEIIVVFWGFYN